MFNTKEKTIIILTILIASLFLVSCTVGKAIERGSANKDSLSECELECIKSCEDSDQVAKSQASAEELQIECATFHLHNILDDVDYAQNYETVNDYCVYAGYHTSSGAYQNIDITWYEDSDCTEEIITASKNQQIAIDSINNWNLLEFVERDQARCSMYGRDPRHEGGAYQKRAKQHVVVTCCRII